MRCTAKSKQSGQQCKRHAVVGGTKCYMHGGASLAGIASPTFKHGRYSKSLPERLAARYAEAQDDPRLLELRDEVALIDTRLAELLTHLDSGESAKRWQAVNGAYADLRDATARSDSAAFKAAMAAMGEALAAGAADHDIWTEIVTLTDQRRKLVESESKRLQTMQQMITSQQAMVLLAAVVDTIRKHIQDRTVLAAISQDIRTLTAIDPPALETADRD